MLAPSRYKGCKLDEVGIRRQVWSCWSAYTVWSCFTPKKIYSLCASNGLHENSGYMQYRAGKIGNIDFNFPKDLRHPKGVFAAEAGNRGGGFHFANANYAYEISDQLIGESYIDVKKNGRSIAQIICSHAEPSIIDNSSMNLFDSIGLLNK
jgi:hypothetical protein